MPLKLSEAPVEIRAAALTAAATLISAHTASEPDVHVPAMLIAQFAALLLTEAASAGLWEPAPPQAGKFA